MKKGLIILLVVIILVAVIAFVVINNNNASEQSDNTNTVSENVDNSENVTRNSIESDNEVLNETGAEYENDGTYTVSEVDEDDYNSYYTVEETDETYADSFDIEENGDELTIIFYDTELNEYLLGDDDGIEYDTEYTVTNSGDIEAIFVGEEGQDWNYPLVLLLQTDGTVKGIDMEEGYKAGEFIAKDITELEDIESFEQVSVAYPDDSGYRGVVAIAEDGTVYEISAYQVEFEG